MINSPHVAPFLMGCAGSRAVTPSLGGNGHAAEVSDADARRQRLDQLQSGDVVN